MSNVAIRVEGLGKQYRIGAQQARYKRFSETMMDLLASPVRRLRQLGQPPPPEETIWALRDVSFEVGQGEVLGIIGRNGAGKSTLLKILSRITEPTEGYAELDGRVGSLLEVGTGFHPELTGRENIFLNGAILGMSKTEIDRNFDEIVAFAEVEQFIDTPVKRYSSGMFVRLAFAVAAHLETEILLVDEVLAVGDAAFQKKCLGKMGDVAQAGRTVLFVSHNMSAIARLCQDAIWLDAGKVRARGEVTEVIQNYLSEGVKEEASAEFVPKSNRAAQILSIELLTPDGTLATTHLANLPVRIRVRYRLSERISAYRVGLRIRLADGLDVMTTASSDVEGDLWTDDPGVYSATVEIPGLLLAPGQYFVTVFLGQPGVKVHDRHENVLAFRIEGRTKSLVERELGLIATPLHWEASRFAVEHSE